MREQADTERCIQTGSTSSWPALNKKRFQTIGSQAPVVRDGGIDNSPGQVKVGKRRPLTGGVVVARSRGCEVETEYEAKGPSAALAGTVQSRPEWPGGEGASRSREDWLPYGLLHLAHIALDYSTTGPIRTPCSVWSLPGPRDLPRLGFVPTFLVSLPTYLNACPVPSF